MLRILKGGSYLLNHKMVSILKFIIHVFQISAFGKLSMSSYSVVVIVFLQLLSVFVASFPA